MTLVSWSPQQSLDPTPAQARQWLDDELNGSAYHEPWLGSVIRWIKEHVQSLFDGAGRAGNSGLGIVVTVVVALVVIALLVWVLPKVRRESAVARAGDAVLQDLTISPAAYRDLAAQAWREGRFGDSILDGFRALAKDMSDRTLLDDAPGRTAHEVSLALAPIFPDHADRLAQAANLFDSVRYGQRQATSDQASAVRTLDTELIKTRPTLAPSQLQDLTV